MTYQSFPISKRIKSQWSLTRIIQFPIWRHERFKSNIIRSIRIAFIVMACRRMWFSWFHYLWSMIEASPSHIKMRSWIIEAIFSHQKFREIEIENNTFVGKPIKRRDSLNFSSFAGILHIRHSTLFNGTRVESMKANFKIRSTLPTFNLWKETSRPGEKNISIAK